MHTALYRFYNAEGRLLYVGITSVGPSRWKQHAIEKGWWTEVASITIEHFDTRAEAAVAERTAIQAERPMHNVIHSTQRPTVATPAVIRRHGMGTMSQRQDGRWSVGIFAYGWRKQWTFTDEADARLILAAIEGRWMPAKVRQQAAEILLAGDEWRPIRKASA